LESLKDAIAVLWRVLKGTVVVLGKREKTATQCFRKWEKTSQCFGKWKKYNRSALEKGKDTAVLLKVHKDAIAVLGKLEKTASQCFGKWEKISQCFGKLKKHQCSAFESAYVKTPSQCL
jgi:hypothetical protein